MFFLIFRLPVSVFFDFVFHLHSPVTPCPLCLRYKTAFGFSSSFNFISPSKVREQAKSDFQFVCACSFFCAYTILFYAFVCSLSSLIDFFNLFAKFITQ